MRPFSRTSIVVRDLLAGEFLRADAHRRRAILVAPLVAADMFRRALLDAFDGLNANGILLFDQMRLKWRPTGAAMPLVIALIGLGWITRAVVEARVVQRRLESQVELEEFALVGAVERASGAIESGEILQVGDARGQVHDVPVDECRAHELAGERGRALERRPVELQRMRGAVDEVQVQTDERLASETSRDDGDEQVVLLVLVPGVGHDHGQEAMVDGCFIRIMRRVIIGMSVTK